MIDVQAVARALLEGVLPRAMRSRLRVALGLDDEAALGCLAFLVGLHDLGKASPAFQKKLPAAVPVLVARGFDLDPPSDAVDHGTLGVHFAAEAIQARLGAPDAIAWKLARAVAAHHGSFPKDVDSDRRFGSRERGGRAWTVARAALADAIAATARLGAPVDLPAPLGDDHAFFVLLAGLTSVADWIGSMAEVFSYVAPPEDPLAYAALARERAALALEKIGFIGPRGRGARAFEELFPFVPWPLHTATMETAARVAAPALIVIEAPMGEGKTEAALYVADHLAAAGGHAGLFFGLPTQATANQMFGRVGRFLERTCPDEPLRAQLVHGEAAAVRLADIHDDAGRLGAERWFAAKKRALLAPYAIGTVDQALLGVLRVRHGFVRLFGLGGKTVILDEVHAYDTYTSTLLDRLVAWLGRLGASVVLLSATLPSERRRQLCAAYGLAQAAQPEAPYPRLTVVDAAGQRSTPLATHRPALRVALERSCDDRQAIASLLAERIRGGGCAGWICNTVQRAQDAFRALLELRERGALAEDVRLLLLHARFPAAARAEREKTLEGWLGREGDRPVRCIVVGTQVLEQSLDVDFDLLVTDLAPVDLVLQRAGRLHRHARPARPALVSTPRLILVEPDGPPLTASLAAVARVYDPYVLRRTLLALAGRQEIILPTDIEPLVEAVYTAPDPPAAEAALRADREESRRRDGDQRQDATNRLLPPPMASDDPFAQLDMPFDDDNPELHEMLRALTRLGEPSIDVLCLHEVGGQTCLDRAGQAPVDLTVPPGRDLLMRLLGCSVAISRRGLYHALLRTPVPRALAETALLRDRRVLLFRDGRTTVEGFALQLDPDLGLVIETPGEPRHG